MVNSTKEVFFFSRGRTRNPYLFVTEETIDQFPFFFGSIEYTHNSELHALPTKRHVRSRAYQFD
jgi:hypothetical protein